MASGVIIYSQQLEHCKPNYYNVKKKNFPVKIWCIYVRRNDTGLARLLQRSQRPPQGRPHGPGVVSEANI